MRYDIDFLRFGHISLNECCKIVGHNSETILAEIENKLDEEQQIIEHFETWNIPFLVGYIVNVHHHFCNEKLKQIFDYCENYQLETKNNGDLKELCLLFKEIKRNVEPHFLEEESIVFPLCKRIHHGEHFDDSDINAMSKTMQMEHKELAEILHRCRTLSRLLKHEFHSDSFLMSILKYFKELDDDLLKHVHLENHVLFPKVLELNRKLKF